MELGNDKVAVVTGAGSGIGLALAEAFARSGCSVVLADVQEDALASAEERVSAHGVPTLTVMTDVSKADEVEALAVATVERFGGVHIVCNNAGVGGGGISRWSSFMVSVPFLGASCFHLDFREIQRTWSGSYGGGVSLKRVGLGLGVGWVVPC